MTPSQEGRHTTWWTSVFAQTTSERTCLDGFLGMSWYLGYCKSYCFGAFSDHWWPRVRWPWTAPPPGTPAGSCASCTPCASCSAAAPATTSARTGFWPAACWTWGGCSSCGSRWCTPSWSASRWKRNHHLAWWMARFPAWIASSAARTASGTSPQSWLLS